MILYTLFPTLAGPFSQWKPHLKRAAEMGFDWVFINPIQKLGRSESLYSITDYFRLNPWLADGTDGVSPEDQLQGAIAEARAEGLKLMIDLVIGHCAYDSPLTREHPEWFVWEDGRIAHPFAFENNQKVVWKDLARFDHRNTKDPEGLYRYCLRVVEHLLSLGFEGFRCDAAYQLPNGFWQRLINEIRSRHGKVCFIAETLGCTADQTKETARAGFDYVFNSSKWWNFHDWWLIEQYHLVREAAPSISFPETHDTPRLCEELNGNIDGLKQRYLFAALFSAGVMIPIGFEFGFRKPLHVIGMKPTDWETTGIELCDFIRKVNAIKREHSVFQEECPTNILPCQNSNVLLLWKASTRQRDEALLILNKDPWRHQDFYTENFRTLVQTGSALRDVSPEYPLEYLHEPFHYALRPGQGIVLVAQRN
jgi:starch synthase (maltosyl-transferring)